LNAGFFQGIIRGAIIEVAGKIGIEIIEGHFTPDSLISSEAAFFTNSLIGAAPISQVDEFKLFPCTQEFQLIQTALLEKLVWI
jgi:Branched-chain amino acid aminotransferase/4-amino-4-deoxychorismate lyase